MSTHFDPAASPIRWSWLTLSGRDAQDFLHRLTTVNARALQIGEGKKGFFLNAQGKVRAYFTLWRTGESAFGFELDGGKDLHWKTALTQVIDQMTFAEQQTLTDDTAARNLHALWIFPDPKSPAWPAPGFTSVTPEGVRFCHHGSTDFGRPLVTAWGTRTQLDVLKAAHPAVLKYDELECWRIQATRPWIEHEINEATNPLEVGLFDAIAENKGCYPGQEVIEKIISLGSPPRRLVSLEGQGAVAAPGTRLFTHDQPPSEIGIVTTASGRDGKFNALAVIRKTHAQPGLEVRFDGLSSTARIARVSQENA